MAALIDDVARQTAGAEWEASAEEYESPENDEDDAEYEEKLADFAEGIH